MSVNLRGIEALQKDLQKAIADFPAAEQEALQKVGDTTVFYLKTAIMNNEVVPTKASGGITLVKTGTLVSSFKATVDGRGVDIDAEGENAHMSNHDLSELLEYGNDATPARPHQRLAGEFAKDVGPTLAGELIAKRLFEKLGS